jgi:hypothetical protein
MKFQVLTAESMKMTAFWDIAPCSVVQVNHVSEMRTASIITIALMMEAVRASETSVYVHLSPFHLTPYNLSY